MLSWHAFTKLDALLYLILQHEVTCAPKCNRSVIIGAGTNQNVLNVHPITVKSLPKWRPPASAGYVTF